MFRLDWFPQACRCGFKDAAGMGDLYSSGFAFKIRYPG